MFLGYNENVETESRDRTDMDLPARQNRLIKRLCEVCGRVAVVLFTGAPVAMPWADEVQAILQAGLAGEGSGEAVAALLLGMVNPSGRLSESYPVRLEDNPSYPYYAVYPDKLYYDEGVFTGYRYYVTKGVQPLFPFGYGLSYTTFAYGDVRVTDEGEHILLETTIENTGDRSGGEVVQWYVSAPQGAERPVIELKAFSKVYLQAGEKVRVQLHVEKNALRRYDETAACWVFDAGEYVFSLRSDCFTVLAELSIGYADEVNNKETLACARA